MKRTRKQRKALKQKLKPKILPKIKTYSFAGVKITVPVRPDGNWQGYHIKLMHCLQRCHFLLGASNILKEEFLQYAFANSSNCKNAINTVKILNEDIDGYK